LSTNSARRTAGERYLDLVRAFPLRSLRTDADLKAAVAMVDDLVDRGDLTEEEQDYLDVLALLVEGYEDRHDPLPEVAGAEALRFLIRENGLSQARLARESGIPVTTLSEILSGKRGISPRTRTALAVRFKVAPSLFV
jgi:HTH-type transcriptional regulator/antitoxin HigA